MALWIRKSLTEKNSSEKALDAAGTARKKKEEKKNANAKRLDNLRIPHQLNIRIKSIGARTEYSFVTKDLSATGAFVVCQDIWAYPFQQTSTILDCIVELMAPGKSDIIHLRFLGKIARIVDGQSPEHAIAGFGLRILQIANDQKNILDSYIAMHGTPDNGMHINTDTHALDSDNNSLSKAG